MRGGGCSAGLEVGETHGPSVGVSVELCMGWGCGHRASQIAGIQTAPRITQHGAPRLAGAACRLGSWGLILQGCGPLGRLAGGRSPGRGPAGWLGWPRSTSVTPREYGLGRGLLHLGKQTSFILGSAEEPPGDWRVTPGLGRASCLSVAGAARSTAGAWDAAPVGLGTTFF